eukprot:TRINITY_DN784_c0_g1_i2.p2 TRINITY_DN784_c0_g1~~TRINITY_DN784_c0_g1_i2.p2  ORF type:complete len:862 (-),score=247.40 TRINITY_DN784_c0_g1_i2:168-2753(-)
MNKEGKPHNPMINSGGIMTSALIGAGTTIDDRWEKILSYWEKVCGERPGFDNAVYLSEKRNSNRNWCLTYMMAEEDIFPSKKSGFTADTNLEETLNLYYMQCSINTTTDLFARVAATLANGGVSPISNVGVIPPEITRNCLSLMASCGVYSYSGEFSFKVGFPAKSGISGCMIAVIPRVGGFCIYSPRVSQSGNSVRALAFFEEFENKFKYHPYDGLIEDRFNEFKRKTPKVEKRALSRTKSKSSSSLPTDDTEDSKVLTFKQMLWLEAFNGCLRVLKIIAARVPDLSSADYDGRTALHLAACENHLDIVNYLLAYGADPTKKDRYNNTPLDDAKRYGHKEIVAVLEKATPKDVPYIPVSRIFDPENKGSVPKSVVVEQLSTLGFAATDRRISDTLSKMPDLLNEEHLITLSRIPFVHKIVYGDLAIPDWQHFCKDVKEMYDSVEHNRDGHVASYIPQLARVNPEQWGVSICTVDGQRMSIGDSEVRFCIQSCCKPLNYLIAQDLWEVDKVHQHVGREPSGRGFNELAMNTDGLPHNPCINSGAIMTCALVSSKFSTEDEYFSYACERYQDLAGGVPPSFANSTYLSERRTADRNFCLSYMMRERGVFPKDNFNLEKTLDFYFMCCSLEYSASEFAVVAATLANGGVCPVTGKTVFSPVHVRNCLSIMSSCGMYDYSGEFAFRIGIPAKSGVAGALLVVIPGVMGFCTFSPRLDPQGNSVRGVEFCKLFGEKYNFHTFDGAVENWFKSGASRKADPTLFVGQSRHLLVMELLTSASVGDMLTFHHSESVGVESADYDGRTPLHLAASEGRVDVVKYLVETFPNINILAKDRWGNTAFDDAKRANCNEIISILEQVSKKRSS